MPKRILNRFEAVENVGMVEFEIVDECNFRQIMNELAAFVEEGAVVFVPFNDKPFAVGKPGALSKIIGQSADEISRPEPVVFENPREQRGRGGLAMCAGHDNRAFSSNKIFPEQFGK